MAESTSTSQSLSGPVLLLGISGPSSSGKTTLSRLLRDIFPPDLVFILHLDDFYLTDAEIPVRNGIQDWDCVESLNLPELQSALVYIKEHGKSPPSFVSKEDQNSVGEHGVDADTIDELKKMARNLVREKGWTTPIAIVDGFLLFSEDMADIRQLFDLKLFLRTSYQTAKRRREARSGYVTLEGFWEDPPDYVDRIVWPNYVKDHSFLFEGGDVDGMLDESVCTNIGVRAMPREAEQSMAACLNWAVQILVPVIEKASQ
ncbi:P-loop containing nucleoside triphosphate hydrolase protein [Melanomma pulvis-pyrius CBS 109.77]|uniref:P-loop containing nucleoside triphosphate hydrolase protein n=1 Tax=Melanomma pulvis-pyrius CBS 109.77 TaxID=1314802 RepID=A0A6A6XD45_9PLEO|nr:P-loop containing nucleoside triphosphate hydrolase protein [Melanomma pulvis-pyrius CBS 109.77]